MHYVNDKWELCCHILSTTQFDHDHTAINLASGLEDFLSRWKLSSECITADNAANTVSAIRILGWQHLGCFNHTLQLAVQKAVQSSDMAVTLGRAR